MMIGIDLNVRINGNHTWTYLDPTEAAALEIGAAYVAYEAESGLHFPATLVTVGEDGYVELDVAWAKGTHGAPVRGTR